MSRGRQLGVDWHLAGGSSRGRGRGPGPGGGVGTGMFGGQYRVVGLLKRELNVDKGCHSLNGPAVLGMIQEIAEA